ncbi:MAG TPA: hypothetical protein VFR67_31195 [Pilimelia sp.]|nr:hypothetical protein [Pilimelia sp.]
MTVEAGPARGAVYGPRLAASVAAFAAVVVVNAIDLADGSHRWWANFILIPGAALMVAAAQLFPGGRSRAVAGYLLACAGGLIFAVGAILMIGGMGRGWPLMIILPCLVVVGTVRWLPADPIGRAAHRTVIGLAALGVVLGVTFLALRAGLVDPGDAHWWGIFMIAAGLISVANALSLVRDPRGYRFSATVLLGGLGLAAILMGMRELWWRN